MFDRSNYSNKTIEIYEIMSAYYVDIFYNHLYTEANKLKINGNVSSITEGYKHTLNAFIKGLNNPDLYKKSIIGMHHYFINIGYASISFAKCIDKLICEFVPTDYFNSLASTQKMGVLRLVINQSMKTFIKKIVDQHMIKIIDNHKDRDNARILQDDLIDCFIMEREGMYHRFINTNTEINKNENINKLLAEKMQNEIKRLVGEKYEQKRQIVLLKKAYALKLKYISRQSDLINKLNDRIKTFEKSINNQPVDTNSALNSELKLHSTNNNIPTSKTINSNFDNKLNPYIKNTPKPQSKMINAANLDISSKHVKENYNRVSIPTTLNQSKLQEKIHEIPKISISNVNQEDVVDSINIMCVSDNSDSDVDSTFIEVNKSNVSNIITADNDYLRQIKDTQIFSYNMDSETTLADFT